MTTSPSLTRDQRLSNEHWNQTPLQVPGVPTDGVHTHTHAQGIIVTTTESNICDHRANGIYLGVSRDNNPNIVILSSNRVEAFQSDDYLSRHARNAGPRYLDQTRSADTQITTTCRNYHKSNFVYGGNGLPLATSNLYGEVQ